MQEHIVQIGTTYIDDEGLHHEGEDHRDVAFEARKLGEVSYETSDGAVDQVLFMTKDDRLVVHESSLSGGERTSRLFEVDEEKLRSDYRRLGRESGVIKPLTLDEALEENDE